ncbi:MAG: SGNH/GDSL hydrolase family protein [Clostridiales bacterium]|nr:SGNH/GDSL hydrolase family protein [Clostridiales bacterium]
MKTVLFQGDSITDAGRSYEEDSRTGTGYPRLVSAKLGYDCPNEYKFLNRGISGNRVVDLLSRVKCDMINLAPDVMSILIGVNDVWHELDSKNGISADKYENLYNMLLEEVKEALPDIKLMILEPFVLGGDAAEGRYDVFRQEVELRAEASRRVADKMGAVLVPLQQMFDEAEAKAPSTYWTVDGVHPTAAGHELIARAWIDGFNKL